MDGKAKSERPLLAVVDSQGKIKNWHLIQKQPGWGRYVALCCAAAPLKHILYLQNQQVEIFRAGEEHVDLRLALAELHERFGVRMVRVDSGGILNGVLLRAGLVDEVNLVIHPELVGGTSPKCMFVAPDLTSSAGVIPLKLLRAETIRGQYVWLEYAVIRE